MKATHKVYNSENVFVGYIVDNVFYNKLYSMRDIQNIENLYSTKAGDIRVKRNSHLQTVTLNQLCTERYNKVCAEAPFVRDVRKEFAAWYKNYTKYVLYLKGPRQVGKTTELLKFAYANYENVLYVDLADKATLDLFVATMMQPGSKIAQMQEFCKRYNLPQYDDSKKTLLIIDEIQVSSVVYSSLRILHRNLNCDIAVTGSYLGATINPEYFQPAGDTYDVELLPLSFREFIRVFGKETVLNDVSIVGASEDKLYSTLTELYKLYLTIGGFPAVVLEYQLNKSLVQCRQMLKRLLERFIAESAAYFEEGSKMRLVFQNVYKAAMLTQLTEKKGTGKDLTERITQFIKTDTKTFVTRSEVNKAIAWLIYNGVLGTCDLYVDADVKQIQFNRRCYFADTGIFSYLATIVPMQESDKKGLLAETFVYNELRRMYSAVDSVVIGDKPACATYNDYELDFVVHSVDGTRYGIEVKSKQATSTKSLDVMQQAHLIDYAVVAELTHGSKNDKHITIPIYAVAEKFPYIES